MARIVKKEAYAARRNEILDATRRLVYTKGYEQMSVQDILDALQISKGAFYHYFGSKGEALDSLIERIDQLVEADQVAAAWGSPHLSVTPIPLAIETLAAQVEALQQAVREIALEVEKLSAQV